MSINIAINFTLHSRHALRVNIDCLDWHPSHLSMTLEPKRLYQPDRALCAIKSSRKNRRQELEIRAVEVFSLATSWNVARLFLPSNGNCHESFRKRRLRLFACRNREFFRVQIRRDWSGCVATSELDSNWNELNCCAGCQLDIRVKLDTNCTIKLTCKLDTNSLKISCECSHVNYWFDLPVCQFNSLQTTKYRSTGLNVLWKLVLGRCCVVIVCCKWLVS